MNFPKCKQQHLRLDDLWASRCFSNFFLYENVFGHNVHLKLSSFDCAVWADLIWTSKRFFLLKIIAQPSCGQTNPFSPVWWNICERSCVAWIKLFEQTSHTCGRSPVWILVCRFSVSFAEKHLPHVLHEYGFSPVDHKKRLGSFLN